MTRRQLIGAAALATLAAPRSRAATDRSGSFEIGLVADPLDAQTLGEWKIACRS